jgi:4-hydroxy-tetrahydrodipicolinate reductase
MKSRIGVAGVCGRMGKAIVRALYKEEDMELVLAVDENEVGGDCGEIAGLGPIGLEVLSPEKLEDELKNSNANILVDFTNPIASLRNSEVAAKSGVNLIIGTTGFSKAALDSVKSFVERDGISAVISPNMAAGVNLFFKIVKETAASLGDEYDPEIIEVHHHHKKDAPSGTALKTAQIIAETLNRDLETQGVFGRKGMVGERKSGEIGIHSVRAGDVVGDHTVVFAGPGERIEITHRAHSRDAFVNGVLKAIRFLAENKGEGMVYSTWDVLGIK